MSDSTTTVDQDELATDARFDDMLTRVSFQPGILLGAEALSAEQTYHLRRLTRHQRWLLGPGTIFGLRVDVITPADDPTDVRLTVGPGYAIDGLGREVLVSEGYAISLRDWLAAENASPDVAGNFTGGTLFLRVTVRARAAPQALQPVVSELFDAGLDPVVTARIGDSFLLEVTGDAQHLGDTPARPLDSWSPDHTTPAAADLPGTVTTREQATLTGLTDAAQAAAMRLQAWLLRRDFPAFDDSPGASAEYEEASRLLLASVHVTLASLTAAPTTAGTAVNNLVRPFIRPNALLAALPLP
ncbi:hypothetical protein [Rhodopila sp.]|jgi:hypothetical protein|uniref:hypothetical protein n=1 Tax=Rhodopila sp. TaxID=2480087 RepID=UPI002BD99520|nr:hypothetical protein [Rhodopila sp.]HVZ08881.1 hypothetical protein [Rhodopila sp.]